MRYISLNDDEFNELLNFRKSNFFLFVLTCLALVASTYFFLEDVMPSNTELASIPLAMLVLITFSIIFIYANKRYLSDLFKREKKIYKGVLSEKSFKVKTGKYQFNTDGNIFVVDKESYDFFVEGDILEFHTSPLTKYLFKIEKVGSAE